MVTSGIRLGTPAATTRGFGVDEFRQVGNLIGEVLDDLPATAMICAIEEVKAKVHKLCQAFPIY